MVWSVVVRIILRNRIAILISIFAVTSFMAFNATQLEMDYEMVQMLPEDHQTSRDYEKFKDMFGQDASVIFIGMKDKKIFELKYFQKFYDLTQQISSIDGIDSVLSIARIYDVRKNDKTKTFELVNIVKDRPENIEEVDELFEKLDNLPFYKDILFTYSCNNDLIHIIAITLNQNILNSKGRIAFVNQVRQLADQFSDDTGIELHFSGMPYIRSEIMAKVKGEVSIFIILAAVVMAIILYLFFRSFRVVAVSLLIVGIAVVWVLGTMHLLNFKITILTAMIPPLIIVIGIPNCIYLLNKYHQEYKRHGNQIKALSRVVQRVGNATLMTNMTTAVGFATFIIVRSDVLKQFGLVASLNIIGLYLISLSLITIIFSYLPAPTDKHVKHLENMFFRRVVSRLVRIAMDRRKYVYLTTFIVLIFTAIGITFITTTGNVVDDLPEKNPVVQDLNFFENHFTGVLPFEIKIDTKEENGVFENNGRTLYRISRFYRELRNNSYFADYLSSPLSVINGVSFLNQAMNDGIPAHYIVPPVSDLAEIRRYISNDDINSKALSPFIDSTGRFTRISIQMANVSSNEIRKIKDSLDPLITEVFNPPRWYNKTLGKEEDITTLISEFETSGNLNVDAKTYSDVHDFSADDWNGFENNKKEEILAFYKIPDLFDIVSTGMAVVFLEGTYFLLKNLFQSLGLAILLIAVFMVWLFRSSRMVIISLIPNIIPLCFTAAIMGFTGISIKPSTILVFSIAFGISVDNAIHFLAKFRQELQLNKGNRRKSVVLALRETGFSMLYTSITLFFGFAIFIASGFGGTQAMGILVSLTLLLAMLTNLLLLPSLILTLEKLIQTKKLKKARFKIYDDEDSGSKLEIEPEFKKLFRRRRRRRKK